MASKWLEVILRIPVVFLLDFSVSFLDGYLTEVSWPICMAIQGSCIISSLCILVSSNDQLFSIYYFVLFFLHMTAILYLNIINTPLLLSGTTLSLTDIFDVDLILQVQPLAISWFVYVISVFIYSLAFRSIKPVLMALSMILLITKHLQDEDESSFYDTLAFGVAVFIVLQTLYRLFIQFTELVYYQLRIITFRLRMYGALVLFVLHWRRLNLTSILSLFWIIMWNYQMVVFTIFVDEKFHFSFILACASYACNSYLKVGALCFVIQHIVKMILKSIRNLIKDEHTFIEDGQHRPSGLRESVGFLFLSLYTNLTGIDPSKRIVLLELIVLLLISALIRSVFEIVEPYLLSLNSTIHHSRKRHVNLVLFCISLMVMALFMGVHLYRLRERVPFSIPNIITVAQIACALILYFLYTYDSHHGEIWEELDDYVYYIKGACRTFEFILIVLVLGYRVLDTSSKWTAFQIVMVVLHLYVNVYLSLKDGWRSVQLRRLVHRKLNVLPKATAEKLESTDDVCPICLEELNAACITPCNHMFHRFCLRKWLAVQNKCPMCHSTILERD